MELAEYVEQCIAREAARKRAEESEQARNDAEHERIRAGDLEDAFEALKRKAKR